MLEVELSARHPVWPRTPPPCSLRTMLRQPTIHPPSVPAPSYPRLNRNGGLGTNQEPGARND